jgi:RimJ/RimL family protein N-acetyltransferase
MPADEVSTVEADWLGPGAGAPVLRTDRMLLRAWRAHDLEPFGALNADPRVMEHYPAPLTRAQSDDFVRRVVPQFAKRGFSLWAVEVAGVAPFIGYVGLLEPTFDTSFTPCVEIGWRLAFRYWGHGFATEAARAVLAFGFADAGLEEIVSFTVPANQRSIAVMERLDMTKDGEFDHPRLPQGHSLQRHVLYRLSKTTWRQSTASSDTLKRHSRTRPR